MTSKAPSSSDPTTIYHAQERIKQKHSLWIICWNNQTLCQCKVESQLSNVYQNSDASLEMPEDNPQRMISHSIVFWKLELMVV